MTGPIAATREQIDAILSNTRTIAMVGASPDQSRASHGVMSYLQANGFRVLPVNPMAVGRLIRGEHVYPQLADIDQPVDLVDIFRNSRQAGAAVDDAIAAKDALGIKAVWLQLGVRDDAAAERARDSGLQVVMDRCIKIEHRRF
jgi:predicted CoA-binding protein